jgi:hypothetical protein
MATKIVVLKNKFHSPKLYPLSMQCKNSYSGYVDSHIYAIRVNNFVV